MNKRDLLSCFLSAALLLLSACAAELPPREKPAARDAALPEMPVHPGIPDELPDTCEVTLCALGDNLIHESVYAKFRKQDGSWDFSPMYAHVRDIVAGHDISVINQETIFVDDNAKIGSYPLFGTPQEMGDALAEAGFDVVLAATNHSWDRRSYGADTTLRFWKKKHPEVLLLGLHGSPEDRAAIPMKEKNGIRIAMFNYTYGLNGFALPEDEWFKVDLLRDRERFLNDVRKAETLADFTVCFLHIGEEYRYAPTQFQRQYVRDLADVGADLIICAHPHVVEPCETISASDGHPCLVYYSCGNFVSGQHKIERLLGGMAQVRIAREQHEDGGQDVRIVWHDFVPTVTHRTGETVEAYFLSDYDDDLAARHAVAGVSKARLEDLWRQITGTEPHAPALFSDTQ